MGALPSQESAHLIGMDEGGLHLRNHWTEEEMLERDEAPRERNSDSSVQSQYEDSVLPDREWEHEEVS